MNKRQAGKTNSKWRKKMKNEIETESLIPKGREDELGKQVGDGRGGFAVSRSPAPFLRPRFLHSRGDSRRCEAFLYSMPRTRFDARGVSSELQMRAGRGVDPSAYENHT